MVTAVETIVMIMNAASPGPVRIQVSEDGLLRTDLGAARCALGPAGVVSSKREGDGGTPAGVFPLRRVLYRADRVAAPTTGLPLAEIRPEDGWCDDPEDPAYNRPVTLPHPASAERMAREDHLYDICVILGHNDAPPVPGVGSAIFFHLAHPDYRPTEGCVAVSESDMRAILALCGPGAFMEIGAPGA